MPADIGQVRQCPLLLQRLLEIVFAEVALTQLIGCTDCGSGLALADRKQLDFIRIAACPVSDLLNLSVKSVEIVGYIMHILVIGRQHGFQ